jgi:hypothetical protein
MHQSLETKIQNQILCSETQFTFIDVISLGRNVHVARHQSDSRYELPTEIMYTDTRPKKKRDEVGVRRDQCCHKSARGISTVTGLAAQHIDH